MSEPARTEAEIREALKESSREEVVLDEMIRLGFWPPQGVIPADPADEVRQRAELQREIGELRSRFRKLHNEEQLLKEARQKRLAESRRKQKENKERRGRERAERAAAWRTKQE